MAEADAMAASAVLHVPLGCVFEQPQLEVARAMGAWCRAAKGQIHHTSSA